MSKKFFGIILFTLFVFSSSAINAQELFISYKYLTVNAAYDPMIVVANITLGKHPYCIATNNETNRIYVGVDGGLVVLNGETDQVLAEIPLGDDVVALAVNPLTNRIYAGIYGKNVTVIDGATNLKVGAIPQGLYNSRELAVNPVTNLVYIGDWTVVVGQADSVRVYNGENFQYVTSVALGISTYIERVGVTVNPNTNKVYATWSGNDNLYMIDGYTHTITENVYPSSFSTTVTVNSYTNYVYVGNAVLNGDTLEQVTSGYTGEIKAIDPVHNLLYTVSNYENLCRLNGSTHGVIDSLKLHWTFSSTYDRIAVNPTTFKIYITNYYGNETCVVSAGTPAPDTTPPTTSASYDGLWHTSDFTITLAATDNIGVNATYYRINTGPIENVDANGQPLITTEGAANMLEYWSIDNAGNEELPHNFLTGIKLDKTAPTGFITVNDDNNYTTSTSVTLTLTATDATSGVYHVRYSNGEVWDAEPWEEFSTTKMWSLISGDGTKIVYYQIKDNAGLISITYSDTILLDQTAPVIEVPSREPSDDIQPYQSVKVSVNVTDATSQVKNATLYYTLNDGETWTALPMNNTMSNLYEATIPPQEAGTTVRFKITAYDHAGNNRTLDGEETYCVYQVVPEFPTTATLPLFIILTMLAVTFAKKRFLGKSKT